MFFKNFLIGVFTTVIHLPVLLAWPFAFRLYYLVPSYEGWHAILTFFAALFCTIAALGLTAAAGMCLSYVRGHRREKKSN